MEMCMLSGEILKYLEMYYKEQVATCGLHARNIICVYISPRLNFLVYSSSSQLIIYDSVKSENIEMFFFCSSVRL